MGKNYPGCRDVVRKAFELRDVPVEATGIMLASLAESSIKQYDSCFKKWWRFCQNNDVNPYNGTIAEVLKFLTKEFQGNKTSYGTLNSCRSAIALLRGSEVGEDTRVRRFFKGIEKLRPSMPKYDSTWDPKIVLDHVNSWGANEDIPLDKLSFKMVTLLALTTGQRMQTFELINIRNIHRVGDVIEIKIPDRVKTSRLNNPQPTLIVPTYRENLNLCVASTLETYIEKTKDLRGLETKLFISFKKPFKSVSSQTLSRWIKNTLSNSGIDTNVFSAYSTRHASTSAAKRSGVSIDAIRKAAGWSDKSGTFAKFYNRNIVSSKDIFAKAILNYTS